MKKLCLGLLLIAYLFPGGSFAANPKFTISPPFFTIDISLTDLVKEETIVVGNETELSQSFKLSVIDFGNLDESGGIQFLGIQGEKIQNYKYSLTSWLVLEKDLIEVGPHQKEKVKVSVVNKDSLSPGGHYGAVLVTQINDTKQENTVGINQSYASLLFVKKNGGGEIAKLELKKIEDIWGILKLPASISLRFQNGGNVHLVPRGVVTVVDPFGRVVGKGIINIDSKLILPESFRVYNVDIKAVAKAVIPGNYQIKAAYRYDGNENFVNINKNFFWIGLPVLVIGILLLTVIVGGLIFIKKYNRGK